MRLDILSSIDACSAQQWNAVAGTDHPFTRHEFLAALERHGCVGQAHGWLPQHLVAFDDDGCLIGAVPLYLKDNSYGEFVFDWAWADAYQRRGLAYYPKSVAAIPYTPVTGPRLLVGDAQRRDEIATALAGLARQWSEAEELSSLHWLFTDEADTALLRDQGLMLRLGCQFHWENRGYQDFEAFLATLNARKRKKIRRERRHVTEAGIRLRIVHGGDMDEHLWRSVFDFYRITFEKKWGYPTLTLDFFREIGRTMAEQLVLILAYKGPAPVAGAICLRSGDVLYGRHWGCYEDYHSLHFETCYYQGIDYCIANGLRRFEPGAQGEHKISRGFLPTPTWSAHWIGEASFRRAIDRFLAQERAAMQDYIKALSEHSPYRTPEPV